MGIMRGRLRHIALTVEQSDAGYAWLLFESAGGRLRVLERAKRSSKSYLQALQAGYEHLALLSASGLFERGIGYRAEPGGADPEPLPLVELDHAI
jgi:hypothetical protein